jgi:ribosomal protein L40E
MANEGKVCVHCREVNPVDARECRNCGRYFIHRPGAERAAEPPGLEALKQPATLCALVLLVSLFLPWFTILIFSLSAVQLLGLFGGAGASSMRYGAGATLALARLFIALIPVGCAAVILFALRGGSAILIGKLTGLLPLVVFLLFFVQSSNVVSVMGAGFVVAILAGLGLFVFSRGEP